jgi:hypothetical protein
VRRPGGLSRARARALLLLLGATVAALHVLTLPDPPHSHCFHDELQYVQEARDLAAGRIPRYNRAWRAKFPPLYSAALAPAWALSDRDDFPWRARVVNALLLASTLWPAYRIARRLAGRGTAVCAAGLAMVAPWQGFGRQLLSENLALPLFLAFVLATLRLAARPTWARGAAAGLLLGALVLTKTLLGVLAVPFAAAVLGAAGLRRPRAWTALAAAGAAAALVVLPWQLRSRLFPSEAQALPYSSYVHEFLALRGAPVRLHLEMLGEHAMAPLTALGAPVLALALAGLGRRLRGPDAGGQALGVLGLGSLLVLLGLASFYSAHLGLGHAIERYALPLWPLLTVVGVTELARPRTGWLSLAVGLALLLGLAGPDQALVGEQFSWFLFDVPSQGLTEWIAERTGSLPATRAILLAPLLLLVPWARGVRFAPALVVAASALWGAGGLARFHATLAGWDELAAGTREPLWRWLDRWVRQRDTIVHQTYCDGSAYANALRYESDFCVLDFRLEPDQDSAVRFDFDAFRFVFPGAPPRGSTWLLTPYDWFERVPEWPVVGRWLYYRLHRLSPEPAGAAARPRLRAASIDAGGGGGGDAPRLESAAPRLGLRLDLRLQGAAPRAPLHLLVAAGPPVPVRIGPCLVHVDPARAAVLPMGSTDDGGAWSLALELPEEPALVGVEVTLQALVAVAGGPLAGSWQVTNGLDLRLGL